MRFGARGSMRICPRRRLACLDHDCFEHGAFSCGPTGSLARNARRPPRSPSDRTLRPSAVLGAFLHLRSDRQLGAFHPFARWPGSLHRAPHLGLRLPRLLHLVSNLVILSSCNASPVLPSASCGLLSHFHPPIRRAVAAPVRRPTENPPGGPGGFWLGVWGIGDLAAESFHQ